MGIKVDVVMYMLEGAFPALLSAVFLISFIIQDRTFSYRVLNLFVAAIICAIVLSVSDCTDYYLEQIKSNLPMRRFLAAVCYTCRVSLIGFAVAISQRYNMKSGAILYVIMLLNAVVSFLSIPTGCVFYFDEDHSWHMGPLFFVPYVFSVYYGILLLISSYRKIFSNIGEAVIITCIWVVCIIANALELFMGFKLLLASAFVLGIDFYFLSLNVQLYRRDTLTSLLNRRSFYMDAKRYSGKPMVLISMDLNNLKVYNDTEGHGAGDFALCTVSRYMLSVFSKDGAVYRTGGDEFMALFVDKSVERVNELKSIFTEKLSKTRFQVAAGVALYSPGENFDQVIERADKLMYENKSFMKGGNVR